MKVTGIEKIKKISQLSYIALRRSFVKRNKTTVLNEYESGWKQFEIYLDKSESLESWLYFADSKSNSILCNVNGELTLSTNDITEFNRKVLVENINEQFQGVSSITEYGSGLGRNLLYLKKNFPHIECFGYELCENGVSIAKRASEKFNIDVKYSQLDFINDDASKYIFPETDIAFTLYALEQIPKESEKAMRNILNHVKKGSIHLEPIVENYPFTIRGLIGRIDHWKIDYIRNYEKNLKKIKGVTFKKKVIGTSHNPLMFPSVYCVKKMV